MTKASNAAGVSASPIGRHSTPTPARSSVWAMRSAIPRVAPWRLA